MLNGGFRPESAYPLCGLLFAVGWTERRRLPAGLGALGLLCTKEDASIYLGALAIAAFWWEPDRRREALALLLASVFVFLADVLVVQHALLRGSGWTQPGYLVFWGQYGKTIPEILLHMVRHPVQLLTQVATSSWLLMFGPVLLLPLLSPLARAAMLPALFLLGSSSNPNMRLFLSYYPAPLVPFLLWGLFDSYGRLSGWRLRDGLFVLVLLGSPLCIDGYEKFDRPRFDLVDEIERIETALRDKPGPLCVQTVLFPHVRYADAPQPMMRTCEQHPDARMLVDPELDPWPHTREEIAAMAAGGGGARVRKFAGGLAVVER
jgi:hypothetical protein